MKTNWNLKTEFNPDMIILSEWYDDDFYAEMLDLRDSILKRQIDLREEVVRNALIQLGWRPPE